MKIALLLLSFVLIAALPALARDFEVADLTASSREGDLKRVERIVDAGVDVNARDSDGWYPLLIAACHGQTEVVEYLLKEKAGIDQLSGRKNTALIYAASRGHMQTVVFLLKKGADKSLKNVDGEDAADQAEQADYDKVAKFIRSAR